jgi:hypothetical protein
MVKTGYPRLCGGTFLVLLLQARKQRSKARNRLSGGSDGLADKEVLKNLIRVAQPEYIEPAPSSFPQNTSDYKSCMISSGTYLPFNDRTFISAFDTQVKTSYETALCHMAEFIDSFLDIENTNKNEWLIKALLELIDADKSIDALDLFYINTTGQPVNKTEVYTLSSIQFQPFLLGVWHYIVVNRTDNKIGRHTYEQWHEAPKATGQRWRFISSIGENIKRPIKITILETTTDDTEQEIAYEYKSSAEHGEPHIEDEIAVAVASDKTTKQVTQILHAENVTIHNYESDDKPTNKRYDKVVFLPFSANSNFVGRSQQLWRLRRVFVENKATTPTIQTIHGLGGIGKTQLALKYAYEHLDEYDTICWVECKTQDSITKACCEFLLVIGESATEIPRFAHWFQNHSNWLLILDDINESTSVEHLIPKLGNGHIIKTTQIVEGKQVHDLTIPLDKMSIEDAVSFLIIRTNDNDKDAAKAIADRLGRFPLALEQAAAYINELEIDLAEYLKLLREHDLDVFDGEDRVKNYKWNVKTVWNITLERLSDPAKQLLYCFAYMSADILALDLLTEHAKELHAVSEKPDKLVDQIGKDGKPTGVKINLTEIFHTFIKSDFAPELITVLADGLKLNKAVKELKKFSLIKSKKDKTLTMHGLLQEVIRSGITDPVYLFSVAEVMKKRCNEMNLIFNDYHMALPMEHAKSIILNIETLLKYKDEYKASRGKADIDMWELQYDFYSFMAQYLTLRGISEDDTKILAEADRCFAIACEIGLPLYGGGEDSYLSGAHTFTLIQEKHRRMRVNLILNRVDVAKKLYAEIRKPVSKVLKEEKHMSFHAFTNFGDLWREFGYYAEAKECYEYVCELGTKDEELLLRSKIAECDKNLADITNS